jgi:putative transposase
MVGGVGSLSEYQRSVGAVHSIGWHIVWCPKYRKRILVGPVADRLRELLVAKAAERGWSVEAVELMPDHVPLFIRTPPDERTARLTRGKP